MIRWGFLKMGDTVMTKEELTLRLQAEGVRDQLYFFDDETPDYDGYILRGVYGRWIIEYFERGVRSELGNYASETEACQRFYDILSAEYTAKMK